MKELSNIALRVNPSTTLAIDSLAKQMKADGVDVIGFGAGEPDFNTPDNIKAAGIAAIEQNITRYTPAAGTVELRQAVCGRMKADYGLEYKPSQVVVSSGAKHLVYLALRAVVNPGDEVILPAPYWVSYIELIKMVGGVPVVVTATEAEHFKLTAEKLSAAITPSLSCGCAMVVSRRLPDNAMEESSYPHTDISSGTRYPFSLSFLMSKLAVRSQLHTNAVGISFGSCNIFTVSILPVSI